MIYKKTNPKITFTEFRSLVLLIPSFKSLTGKEYVEVKVKENIIYFIRKSSDKKWTMDLEKVLRAYKELVDFKTKNFSFFVPRTHSPALGLLLHLGLLKK